MTVISERLTLFVQKQGKSVTQLAKEIGVSQRGLNSIVNGTSQPSSKTLVPLLDLGLSLDWLYTGEGDMLRKLSNKKGTNTDGMEDSDYRKEMDFLKATIARLEDQLKDKQQIIDLLMSKQD